MGASGCVQMPIPTRAYLCAEHSGETSSNWCHCLYASMQAAVMLPMIFVLIFGCASTLYVVYHKIYPEYATIIGAIRMMAAVTLGGHHLMLVRMMLMRQTLSGCKAKLGVVAGCSLQQCPVRSTCSHCLYCFCAVTCADLFFHRSLKGENHVTTLSWSAGAKWSS